MSNKQMIRSSQQSSKYFPYSLFKRSRETSMYENMFIQDFCMHFSIVLGKKNHYRQFYKVDVEGSALNTLLEYEDHMFLEYDFDKLLARNLNSLLKHGKAYVEVVKLFDEDNNLVGIKLIPFRNNIQISFGNRIYFLLKRYDGVIERGIINREDVISFNVQDIGYTRGELWRMFRKLCKFDLSFVELSMDGKSGFDFDVYSKKKDLELLKVGRRFRWIGRKYNNYYLNEPYLVYLRMEELKLKESILNILLYKYNEKLSEIGKKYGFAGKICYETRGVHFDELYKELTEGVKSCAQVSNEIY